MGRLLGILWLGAISLLAPACTVVRVDGPARVSSTHFGVLRIEPPPGAAMLAYRTTGLGLVPAPEGLTVGYSRSDAVLSYDPSSCQVVVFKWPREGEATAKLMKILKETSEQCRQGERRNAQ